MFSLTISYIIITNEDFPLSAPDLSIYKAQNLEATLKQHRQFIGKMKAKSAAQTVYTAVFLSNDAIADLEN